MKFQIAQNKHHKIYYLYAILVWGVYGLIYCKKFSRNMLKNKRYFYFKGL